MKSLKLISVMMGCLAAVCVTFSSCSDDDDDNRLTPQEQKAAFEAVKGNYSGKMIYPVIDSKTNKVVSDTALVSWSIQSDSMMTIRNFPVSVLGHYVSDTTVSKLMLAEQPQTQTCAIGFIKVSPATFLINPNTVTFNYTYGGKSHKVQVPFYINSSYSFGTLDSRKNLQMQIITGGVFEDGKNTGWMRGSVALAFVGKKS